MSIEPPHPNTKQKIRYSKSTGNLREQASTKRSKQSNERKGFFKKVSIEWNLFLLRLRLVSQEVFNTDNLVEELFESQLSEEGLDRLIKVNRGYTSVEEAFIDKYRQFKSLDKMVQVENLQSQSKTISLQDLIKSTSNELVDDDLEFSDINVEKLRQEFEVTNSTDSSSSATSQSGPTNIGSTLWEYRRQKWLKNIHPEKVDQRLVESNIDHLSQECYVKIYNNLVEKGKPLKHDKRINLKDAIKIINAGWVAEEVWDRAAKGLP